MKIFVFILAFTVLLCGIIPCREMAYTANGQEQSKIIKAVNQEATGDMDNCSPFCSCNCCCGITFLFSGYQSSTPVAKYIPKGNFHLSSEITDSSLPVWQPPQLV